MCNWFQPDEEAKHFVSEIGSWKGSIKNTMEGQGTLMRVVNSAIWKKVVATLSCIIFFRFSSAMVAEYQATTAKERKEPARIMMLKKLLHFSHFPLLLNSSVEHSRISHAVASGRARPPGQEVHVFAEVAPVVELAFPASHAKQVSAEVADEVEL